VSLLFNGDSRAFSGLPRVKSSSKAALDSATMADSVTLGMGIVLWLILKPVTGKLLRKEAEKKFLERD